MTFPTKNVLLTCIHRQRRGSSLAQLVKHFKLNRGEQKALEALIHKLLNDGFLVQHPNKQLTLNSAGILLLSDLKKKHQSRPVHASPKREMPTSFVGVFSKEFLPPFMGKRFMGYVQPVARKERSLKEVWVFEDSTLSIPDGQLVHVSLKGKTSEGVLMGKIEKVLGDAEDHGNFSLIEIVSADLPTTFSLQAMEDAEKRAAQPVEKLLNWREIPFVTIDGEDARDFDDAVAACKDTDSQNPGGWLLYVAIADVSYYVRMGEALDREAYERGTSVYFPDQVIPMLPETLSNGICSLKEKEDRRVLGVCLKLDKKGVLRSYTFHRAVISSWGRLTYTQVQNAHEGMADEKTAPLSKQVIEPLFTVYHLLLSQRQKRGTLDFETMEQKVIFQSDGTVEKIVPSPRYESHRLIEEMMILANVAAASQLEVKGVPCLYRIHPEISPERWQVFGEALKPLGLEVNTEHVPSSGELNLLLEKTRGGELWESVQMMMLRAQFQASYSPHNVGHFGLALKRYAHFTSPIRRYSDLITHRLLISALGLGTDGHLYEGEDLEDRGDNLSELSRRAEAAERKVKERYVAYYMARFMKATFSARISGVTKAGLFVRLDETGAEGFLPRELLPEDFYFFHKESQQLVGERGKISFSLGLPMTVCLESLEEPSKTLIFSWIDGGRPVKNVAFLRRRSQIKRPYGSSRFKRQKRRVKKK